MAGEPESTDSPPRSSAWLPNPGAVLALGGLGVCLLWWALGRQQGQDGAYFAVVFYPGLLLLAASFLVLLRAAPWKAQISLSPPVRLAVGALVALIAWTLLSAFWSPSPDVALADAERVTSYAICFGLGAWACNLLGAKMELTLIVPVLVAAVAGGVAIVHLLTADTPLRYFEGDGTLDYPIGYRNANAAFFMIAVWPALGLATSAGQPRALRAVALAAAAISIEMAVLSQSRGSIIATVAAIVVYLALAPERPRALLWLLLAAVPASICLPVATDLFEVAKGNPDLVGFLGKMRSAGRLALAGGAISFGLALLALRLEPKVSLPARPAWAHGRNLALGALAMVGSLVVLGLAALGSPTGWISDRVDEFNSGSDDIAATETNRLSLNASSNRSDLWRVALEAAGDDPLFGDGAGGYRYRYLRDRNTRAQVARDAHSVELEILSEFGIPGLALFLTAVAAAFAGALRSRRLGPAAARLSCAALAAATYWLVHVSLDWFWPLPSVTAPAFLLLGAACAPALLTPMAWVNSRGRIWLAAATALVALVALPLYLSERYVNDAYLSSRVDLPRAYSDLDRARALNPLSDEPLLAEGAIARQAGDRGRAISSFRDAAQKRPEEFAGHYFLALLYAKSAPRLARAELQVVVELNPLSRAIERVRRAINRSGGPARVGSKRGG